MVQKFAPGWSLGMKVTGLGAAHAAARDGLPLTRFHTFLDESGLVQREVTDVLNLPPATLARRRTGEVLRPDESERLIRLALLFEQAAALFEGDIPAAQAWLRAPVRGLGGATPLALARTSFGARMVEDLIGRLEHGVVT